jgi:ABC-type proline/glycine betaine transport system ATPase subunit
MNDKNYQDAKAALLTLDPKNDFVRKFLTECILQTEDFELAINVFSDPQTDEEEITVLNAAIQLGKKTQMKAIAEKINSNKPTVKAVTDLIKKIEALTK